MFFNRIPRVPGSLYAAELNREDARVRFPRELERGHRLFHLASRRSHGRYFNAVALDRIEAYSTASKVSRFGWPR